VPDLDEGAMSAEGYVTEMFNPTLTILPDFDSSKGQPVQRTWVPRPGAILMEMQNAALTDSASRILDGLDLFGHRLQVRCILPGEAASMPWLPLSLGGGGRALKGEGSRG